MAIKMIVVFALVTATLSTSNAVPSDFFSLMKRRLGTGSRGSGGNAGVVVVDGDEFMMKGEFDLDYVGAAKEQKRNALTDASFYWPDGKIHYEIDESVDERMEKEIDDAIEEWREWTCLKFIKVAARSSEYRIIFKDCGGKKCYSWVGYQFANYPSRFGKGQNICLFKGKCPVAHQIGHAIGLHHEQNRADRDKYVTINWDNVKERSRKQFGIKNNVDYRGVPYDYLSVMHDARDKNSKNGEPTILTKDPAYASKIGQSHLRMADAALVNLMYNCPEKIRKASICTKWHSKKRFTLHCLNGGKVEVVRAFYGYWEGDNEKHENCYFKDGDCKKGTKKPTCSTNICKVTAGKSSFSWSCRKVHDYMQVEYKCVL